MLPAMRALPRGRWWIRCAGLLCCACCAGCEGFGQADADAGAGAEAGLADRGAGAEGPAADGGPRPDLGPVPDAPRSDAPPTPGGACRPLALDCLAPTDPKVFEVPSEGTLAEAFAAANAGDTVQIKGLKVPAGWWIPPHVIFRGCAGASITGGIAFKGDGGAVEGFAVSGQIVANRTGAYVIRRNRFVATSGSSAAVSATATDGIVAAAVTAVVEANWFEDRARGVEALTRYDTLTHSVTITVRNNIFTHVDKPIVISEDGLVGKISARIEHNTIHAFDTALTLTSLSEIPIIAGTLLADGKTGVFSSSAYEVSYSAAWQVTTPHSQPPLSGSFASGDPAFVDAAGGDLRLAASSPLVDRIPSSPAMPAEDFAGCPRPVALSGGAALGDIGALETQPE